MKRQLLLTCLFVLSFFAQSELYAKVADSRHIILMGREHPHRPRSAAPIEAWVDETGVYVSFYTSVEEATLRILDQTGAIVEEVVAVSPETVQLALPGAGEYKIEILYGDMFYYGFFDGEEPEF